MPIAKLLPTLIVAAAFALFTSHASAQDSVSVINFSGLSTGGGVGITNTGNRFFETLDDGDFNTIGNQTTPVTFKDFLNPLTDSFVGSVTISGVELNDDAVVVEGISNRVFTTTSGGQISLFDDNNALVLSGDLGEQRLIGSESGGSSPFASGSFRSTGNDNGITFTGGFLLDFLDPNSGGLSLTLSNILTDGVSGLTLDDDTVLDFTANVTGQIAAAPSGVPVTTSVPEPTTLPLLIFGLALFSGVRKRSSVR